MTDTLSAAESRKLVLPYAPRGLRRPEAAAYIGVSVSTFDKMIRERFMPRPKRYRGLTIWDRLALDEALACLPEDDDAKPVSSNPWDAVSFS
jgi:predicted DNA-binding transcriptional regulator AlpA